MIKDAKRNDIAQMREVGDRIKEQIKSGVFFLYAAQDKATFMTMATADIGSTFDAGKAHEDMPWTQWAAGGGQGPLCPGRCGPAEHG